MTRTAKVAMAIAGVVVFAGVVGSAAYNATLTLGAGALARPLTGSRLTAAAVTIQ